ncbi:MAG: hypothetical protein HQK50_02110 [Oligoflexia bacterium]|nr:hypothetical protein [Oligoflexia bacterium]MBF0364333.1 hypothetical protein [Oligoflexia bacterium]
MRRFLLTSRTVLTHVLMLFLVLTIGCGQVENKVVKDVSLKASIEDSEVWLGLSAVFNLGSMSMTGIKLPIIDPNDSSKVYGEIFFKPTMEGNYNEVGAKINLSYAAKLPGGFASLPNGEELPVGGSNSSQIIELAISQIHSKVYIGLDQNFTLFGFAISIKEFDTLAKYVGGANIFLGFNIKGIRGMVGVYTGLDTLQSGLAFFVDLSSVITVDILNDIINGVALDPTALSYSKAQTPWSAQYKRNAAERMQSKLPSAAVQRRFATAIERMSDKEQTLHFVEIQE